MTWKVPAAADGTEFDEVTCRRGGGYRVGPKGKEYKFASFRDALAALNLMESPCWRRPNSSGNWGIVSGVGWL